MRFGFVLPLLGSLLLISACASQNFSQLKDGEYIHIENVENLDQYWLKTDNKETYTFRASSENVKAMRLNNFAGHIRGAYWIDSRGQVSQIEIHNASPAGEFQDVAARLYRQHRYQPGPNNPQALPAKVEFDLKLGSEAEES